ncbi:AraC family transcriptional regulator [Euryhalocaulis caribicus]|uniref:AraC family transcriptional regulator n=1 Tax=Euryhalocaulis caribicus TaxID=1161401 RepID=UPI0003B3712A|nr:AraC family transcriptional regulator [Euryhalocaulis caribicus]
MTYNKPSAGKSERNPSAGSAAFAKRIAKWTAGKNQADTPVPGLTLHRWPHPTEPTSYMLAPSICLIGQGRKRLFLGDNAYVYDASQFLITSVDLPVVSQIIEATKGAPYLGLTLELDLKGIARMMLERERPPQKQPVNRGGIAVSEVSPPLLNAIERLIDLLESPEDIPALAPLLMQEISYRLLIGEQGPRLYQLISAESHSYRIARAIDWLKDNFDKPLRVGDLAYRAGLSSSAFHNHFRALTAMSPLQYQKKMRLNEARRLMFTEHLGASDAAFEVGYESPTQFSREYSRMFGAPPARDIQNLIQETAR